LTARLGLQGFVATLAGADASTRAAVLDLIVLSTIGLHSDNPAPEVYRARRTTLTTAAAPLLTPRQRGLTPP
jgi:hypothetical protein